MVRGKVKSIFEGFSDSPNVLNESASNQQAILPPFSPLAAVLTVSCMGTLDYYPDCTFRLSLAASSFSHPLQHTTHSLLNFDRGELLMTVAPSSKASGYPAGFISLMNGLRMFIYTTVRLSEDASGSRFMSNNLMLADNRMFFASLEAFSCHGSG